VRQCGPKRSEDPVDYRIRTYLEARTMSNATFRIPSYRRHKPTGQAVVTLGGRDIYLGKYNSAASRIEYNRLIAEWTANNRTFAPSHDLTVVELAAAFMRHAKDYYRRPDGSCTGEVANYRTLIGRLRALYGRTRAADFGPLALKAVRQQLVDAGLSRMTINQADNRIRHMFKWGVENQLIEPSVLHGLQAVGGLRVGRSAAKETTPVKPVPDAFVDAVLDHVSSQVAAMVRLQRVTGMRSGEVTIMRACDIQMSGATWIYTPTAHKTAWHGHDRKVYLGPRAQAIIRPFLRSDLRAIVAKLVEMAKAGDLAAIRELLDRAIGKPKSTVEVEQAALVEAEIDAELDDALRELATCGEATNVAARAAAN